MDPLINVKPNSNEPKNDHIVLLVAGLLTSIVIGSGYILFIFLANGKDIPSGFDAADKIGSYMSGVFSLVATVWICATFYMQMRELNLQRSELKLQREASQSAASSYRAQLLIALCDNALRGMSDAAETLFRLLYGDEPHKVLELYKLKEGGEKNAAFRFLIDQSDLEERVEVHLLSYNIAISYATSVFCHDVEKYNELLSDDSIPQEVASYLLQSQPVYDLYQIIKHVRERLEISSDSNH